MRDRYLTRERLEILGSARPGSETGELDEESVQDVKHELPGLRANALVRHHDTIFGHPQGCWLEVGVDSVGVGECELFECLFPIGGDLAFDEPSGAFRCSGGRPCSLARSLARFSSMLQIESPRVW